MDTERRDREVGAGYDYQWDVATYVLLAFVVRRSQAMQSELREALDWLGRIEAVRLEGREVDKSLEDLSLSASDGRSLRIQVKETDEDLTQHLWRPKSDKLVEFLNRIGHDQKDAGRRFVFLSNGTFHADVRAILSTPESIAAFYDTVLVTKYAGPDAAKCAPRNQFIANAGMVSFCTFLAATPVAQGVGIDGIGRAIINQLVVLGMPSPEQAYLRLRHKVMEWSFRMGGTSFTVPDLRSAILDLLGLKSMSAGGPWVVDLVDYLKQIDADSQDWPSWSDFTADQIWSDDPAVVAVEGTLSREGLVLIVGGQGTGKTAVTRTLAYRLHAKGYVPVYWDFEHLGRSLPALPADYWHSAVAHARVLGGEPLLVLENVHLNVDAFHAILGMRKVSRDASNNSIPLIATSRAAGLGDSISAEILDTSKVLLSATESDRGSKLLTWWLEHRLHLDAEAQRQVLIAVPWSQYLHDFWVLRLALDALDLTKRSLPMWAVERMLGGRLRRTIDANPGADDFLYLVSGLGRGGAATDLDAAARALEQPSATIRQLAEQANRDGLVSIDRERHSCRFWHDSLARSYWEAFALERDRWAVVARRRFADVQP